jgi:hypothetical protein
MRTAAAQYAVLIHPVAPRRGIRDACWWQRPSARRLRAAQQRAIALMHMRTQAAAIHPAATACARRIHRAAKASGTTHASLWHARCAMCHPTAAGPAHVAAVALRHMTTPAAKMAHAAPSCAISTHPAVMRTGMAPAFPSRANIAAAPSDAALDATSPA